MEKEEVKEKENKKATEGKEKKAATKKLKPAELAELSPRDYHEYRKLRREECNVELMKILTEYDCALDSEILIASNKIEPKIKIIDAYPQGGNNG